MRKNPTSMSKSDIAKKSRLATLVHASPFTSVYTIGTPYRAKMEVKLLGNLKSTEYVGSRHKTEDTCPVLS